MWLILAFTSALLLGFYDVSKKKALQGNAVLTVLLLNTLFSTIIFLPIILSSQFGWGWFGGRMFDIPRGDLRSHLLVVIKSGMVLTSWIFGYFGLKHTPLSIYGPISATRPVLVLIGAMVLFGERLNLLQWSGVVIALFSIYLLSLSGKKEGINFAHNKWIIFAALATIIGACCGLYDKYIMKELQPVFVQSWFCLYQLVMMSIIVLIIKIAESNSHLKNGVTTQKFHWSSAIPLISIFICAADFAYFYSLSFEESMISIVSMIRRGSVIVSFTCAALLFREKNLKAKALDLLLVLLGMLLICLGSL